jgi:hypothetical protein
MIEHTINLLLYLFLLFIGLVIFPQYKIVVVLIFSTFVIICNLIRYIFYHK